MFAAGSRFGGAWMLPIETRRGRLLVGYGTTLELAELNAYLSALGGARWGMA